MNDEQLVRKAQKDHRFFDQIYHTYFSRVFAYVNKRVNTKENAEDITSEVFEKALKGIDVFQWEGKSLEHWLYTIARNTINDFYRKRVNREGAISLHTQIRDGNKDATLEDIVGDGSEEIEYGIIASEEEVTLYEILMELSDEDQYLLYYKYFADMTNKEIAKLTGISETNVGTKLQRLRDKMKKELSGNEKSSKKI